jgi:hypothetical protein
MKEVLYKFLFLSIIICALSTPAYAQKTKKKTVSNNIAVQKEEKNTIAVQKEDTEIAPVTAGEEEPYMKIVNYLKNKSGWINNRNSDVVRGIYGYVKGVYSSKGKIYIMVEIRNKTNIDYEIQSISFLTNPIADGKKQFESDEKNFFPIWQTDISTLNRKSKQKVIAVFNKFTIADNKNLLFVMSEIDGERTLTLQIKPDYITQAEYIK